MRISSAFLVAAGLTLAAPSAFAESQSKFYQYTPDEASGAAGTLIRAEKTFRSPEGGTAYRMLYRSTNRAGQVVPVSGLVIVPNGNVPDGGRPVVSWGHPTTGVAPQCAPSLGTVRFDEITGLDAFLNAGYVVVATDYPGLGTPETAAFLVGVSEGHAMLDAVRAAQDLPASGAGNRVVLWGYSQGGHAALFAGMEAGSYAPQLAIAGVAAVAPIVELTKMVDDDFGSLGGDTMTALMLWSWAKVYDAPMDQVVDPAAIGEIDKLAGQCLKDLADLRGKWFEKKALEKDMVLSTNPAEVPEWKRLLVDNTPGRLPKGTPVFMAQGTEDSFVTPDVTKAYGDQLCIGGAKVEMLLLENTDHWKAAKVAEKNVVQWIADRFAGVPAPTVCQ